MYVPERKDRSYYSTQNEDDDDEDIDAGSEASTPPWPQSYRHSMDAYSFLTPPNLSLLKPASMTGSDSFLSTNSYNSVPLFGAENEEHHKVQLLSSEDCKGSESTAGLDHIAQKPNNQGCSSMQAMLNGVNVLAGVGILGTPYAIKQGGWIGLLLLFALAFICCYTGIMLRKCLESKPGLQTYPDIGQAAFGNPGRLITSVILYIELYACCVEFLILEADNLSILFPGANLTVFGSTLDSHKLFALLSALFVLPTVWLRNLQLLSYVSAGGVIASVVVVLTVLWVGAVDGVGFHEHGNLINLSGLPTSIGLFGFCYSGHAVFPNIFSSMKNKSNFNRVLTSSFALCAAMFGGVAIMGYMMFGEDTQSQVTLNMPKQLVASKIALWTIIINPFTKYALTITPVALSLEELLPAHTSEFSQYAASIFIRTALVASTAVVAISVPFFGFVMAFIGSFLSMTVSLILPSACYMSIRGKKLSLSEFVMGIAIMLIGIICAIGGTYSSLCKIIQQLNN